MPIAYAAQADGSVLGFIDLPGHEKLTHNMLAGATGIDFLLLLVAKAMQQTCRRADVRARSATTPRVRHALAALGLALLGAP